MKGVMKIISTLAIANLMAFAGFVGWLAQSGRLNGERMYAIRSLLSKTVAEETAEKEAAEKALKDAEIAAKNGMKDGVLPVRADVKIAEARQGAEIEHQNKLRLESELKSLQEFLTRENERLTKLEADLATREKEFAAERKKVQEIEGTEQFKKALATLSGLKAKEAQTVLNELLTTMKHDEVVAYLNSMEERQRSKVLAEFNKVDPKMAADLLERLKGYGVGVKEGEAAANASDKSGS